MGRTIEPPPPPERGSAALDGKRPPALTGNGVGQGGARVAAGPVPSSPKSTFEFPDCGAWREAVTLESPETHRAARACARADLRGCACAQEHDELAAAECRTSAIGVVLHSYAIRETRA